MFARIAATLAVDRRRLRRPDAVSNDATATRRPLPVAASPRADGVVRPAGPDELDRLHGALDAVTRKSHPRTAKLLASGTRKPAQKVIEEAGEVALEAVKHDVGGVVRESADLLYHLVVLWRRNGIAPAEIWTEMRRRADLMGLAEKPPKARKSSAPEKDR